jgi:NAD(P)-dependent dehydrogenase (short-subunit alcohol dehydrogenase family)
MSFLDLSGKTAIVTGGNQGIGFAIAQGLARHGAHTIIANRRAEQGVAAAQLLLDEGLSAAAIHADVSDGASVQHLVDSVIERHGHIDILVNSAAVIVRKPVEELTEDEWQWVMDINVKGTFLCCRDVGRHMIERRSGKIVNISSNVSQVIQPLRSVYAVSKAAVSHLTRALAVEWATYGINVNAVAPGPTVTDFNRQYLEEHPADKQRATDSIPMARLGAPGDHVGAAVFLSSAASDYITGQTLLVDGGSTLW